jgi:membrane protein implicated in regulation of membrane protease activity
MSWWLWTILGILAIVIEVNATRDLSLFCVGLSAMVVAALAGFDVVGAAWAQWVCFSAIAIALLFLLRTCVWRITDFPRISNSPHIGKESRLIVKLESIILPEAGEYTIRVCLEGEENYRTTFRVIQAKPEDFEQDSNPA